MREKRKEDSDTIDANNGCDYLYDSKKLEQRVLDKARL